MTQSIEPQFIHQFIPATQPDLGITLLLLHGTGGNEQDLLTLGASYYPEPRCSAREGVYWRTACHASSAVLGKECSTSTI